MNELASGPAVLSDDVAVLPVAEVAQMLAVPVSRVHQMVRDGQLLSVRRDGAVWVPSDFFTGHAPVKGLSGTIMLLRDGGYDDARHPALAVRRRPLAAGQPDRGAACGAAPRGQAARPGDGVLSPSAERVGPDHAAPVQRVAVRRLGVGQPLREAAVRAEAVRDAPRVGRAAVGEPLGHQQHPVPRSLERRVVVGADEEGVVRGGSRPGSPARIRVASYTAPFTSMPTAFEEICGTQ